MKRCFVLVIILVLFCFPISLLAQEKIQGDKKDYPQINNKEGIPLTEMDLSEEQNKKIENINVDYRNKILQLRSQLMVKQIELKSLLRDSNTEEKKICSTAREFRLLNVELQKMMINYQLEIRRTLTPEQIESWRTLENPPAKRGWRP
ncbi:MAG: periplasmic heavy metal sensor [Deltaproteobacteria bacterium]|nr:periplasmic heavy metal sensor [Deltaproteobacteria bacterium]